jgi:hypothetical protein
MYVCICSCSQYAFPVGVHLQEEHSVYGRRLWIQERNENVGWIHPSQVRAQMHALVEFVINFQV